jgi:predicted metal-dependent hydrolase
VRGDAPAAARLSRRAAALLPAESSERLKLLPRIGSALIEAGSWDDAKGVLSEAAASAQRVGDRGAAARAAVGLVFVDIHTNAGASHAKVRTELEDAIRVFEELDDKSGLARALHMAAMLRLWGGENAQGIEEMALAAQYAREAGDRAQEIESLAGIMMGLLYGPAPVVTALERIEEIERQSDGARRLQAGALRVRAGLQAMRGKFGEARELIGTADRIAEELGLEVLRAAGILRMAGEIEFLAGNLPAAERFLRKAHEMLERDKDWGHLVSNTPLLAEVLLAQGRADEAEPLLEAAAPWVIEDDNEAQILFHRARSKLAGHRGDATAAEGLARVAVERAGTGDEVNIHASALVCLADALELGERGEEASAVLQDALRLYERKGNVVAAERVRRRLGAD